MKREITNIIRTEVANITLAQPAAPINESAAVVPVNEVAAIVPAAEAPNSIPDEVFTIITFYK